MFRRKIVRRRKNLRRRRPVRRQRGFRRVSRRVVGVPSARYAKLSYCDTVGGTVTAYLYNTWTWQSSLYDPYALMGGHQPMYFDQFATLYRKYTVLGIGYTFQVVTDASTNGPLFATVTTSGNLTAPSSLSMARERKGTKETTVSHGYRGHLKGYISVKNVLGLTAGQLRIDDQYSALVSANPAIPAYMHLQLFNLCPNNITAYISCRLTFYCRFFDPIDVGQS